ncbi:uncharacterized protein LOC101856962 isoform X2 [Aplysia californica]|nr:uncharacterized protein LOC101856962 isoform X2 [Aplysia californica]XP_035825230.1 uncharacterized protein LOC101856962 isoform X2 [Aplysia californica]
MASRVIISLGMFAVIAGTALHLACVVLPKFFLMPEMTDVAQKFIEVSESRDPYFFSTDAVEVKEAFLLAAKYSSVYYGLWKVCSSDIRSDFEHCYDFSLSGGSTDVDVEDFAFKTPGWLVACQALSVIGTITAVGTAVLAMLILCSPPCKLFNPIWAGLISGLAAAFIFVMNVVFLTQNSAGFLFWAFLPDVSEDASLADKPRSEMAELFTQKLETGWCVWVDLTSGGLCLVASIVFFYASCSAKRVYRKSNRRENADGEDDEQFGFTKTTKTSRGTNT